MKTPAASPGSYRMAEEVFSLPELQKRFDIPPDEAQSFRAIARIYQKGSMLICEGDTDKTLFLIRGGSVGIFKQMGEQEEMISSIDAVNFVGEMSCIMDAPRTATVRAISEMVLVYAITSPNFPLILSNPKWADSLMTRITKDLYQTNTNLVTASTRIQELTHETQRLNAQAEVYRQSAETSQRHVQTLLNIVLRLMKIVRDQAVIGSKGWFFQAVATESVERFARLLFPGLNFSASYADLQQIREDLESAQKAESRSNLVSVYEELKSGLDQ
jgi:CRP/FNR family transcriptional regulator, cyclic AMP receptor protein